MSVFFNDNNRFAVDWLRNLYPNACVNGHSIHNIVAQDLVGFNRVHLFAGIGGWEYALQIAGWPDDKEIWTGSCPCQPFSNAGAKKGEQDPRHLWPEFRRLIAECRPATIFGEQVASKRGRAWLSRIRTDLEALGYAVGAADLCAASVGAPHIRQRLFWVADSSRRKSAAIRLGNATRCNNWAYGGKSCESKRQKKPIGGSSVLINCRDNACRRISTQPGDEPLVARLPRSLGPSSSRLQRMEFMAAKANVTGRLTGYGNSIVPQLAAVFVQSFVESLDVPLTRTA